MYHQTIRQFARTLRNLDAILGKAITYAETRKFDPNNFITARLFPDMLPFAAQIRIACDSAKAAAANLSGKEAPKHEDNETTFAELRGRIGKCLAYLDSFKEADFAATSGATMIKLPNHPGKGLLAEEYLLARQIPNFYFHVVTAYALLRAGGVDVGKKDYLGQLDVKEV
jgi:uncharacterized protein